MDLPVSTESLLIIGCVTFATIYLLRRHMGKQKFLLIPNVEGGYPFFGVVFTMIKGSPWDTLTDWARIYGGMYRIHIFGSDAVVISDPRLLKIVLSTKLSNFKKDVVWTYKPFMALLGKGLVTSEGDEWRRQRTLFSHKLRIDILKDVPAVSIRAVRRLSDKLAALKKRDGVMEIAEEFRHLTLQVITEILVSLDHGKCDETLAHMYLPIVEEGNLRTWRPERMYLPLPSYFKYERDVKTLNDFISALVAERVIMRCDASLPRKGDILDFMLDNIPAGKWDEAWAHQIRDEIKTFVLAGHETSASMLTWSVYELATQPEIMDKVKKEAIEVFGDRYDDDAFLSQLTREQLDKLVFTQCCLKESLRKYSVVPTVVRIADESMTIGELRYIFS
jgi:cytochrome P450